jgi:hypothetical protein
MGHGQPLLGPLDRLAIDTETQRELARRRPENQRQDASDPRVVNGSIVGHHVAEIVNEALLDRIELVGLLADVEEAGSPDQRPGSTQDQRGAWSEDLEASRDSRRGCQTTTSTAARWSTTSRADHSPSGGSAARAVKAAARSGAPVSSARIEARSAASARDVVIGRPPR